VKVWLDNDGNGNLDADDDVQVDDDFSSATLTMSYDGNGNLTGDGVYHYVYDAWNRLRKVQRVADGDTTTLAEYQYLPDNRRASKVVSHCGSEAAADDGGNTTVHFYYSNKWQILETRNASGQATRQWVWGTRYVDEVLFMDVNGRPDQENDCDPDVLTDGEQTEQSEADKDRRYFYHQDRNWNVVALTEYDPNLVTNARVVERYAYTPYGEFLVTAGDAGSGELGAVRLNSYLGNPFVYQGLMLDAESASVQNRFRWLSLPVGRFGQPDPMGHADGLNMFTSRRNNALGRADASGLGCCISTGLLKCCLPWAISTGGVIGTATTWSISSSVLIGPSVWSCTGAPSTTCTVACGCVTWSNAGISWTCSYTNTGSSTFWFALALTGNGPRDCFFGAPTGATFPSCP
jgi:RHS repeat-associated protein